MNEDSARRVAQQQLAAMDCGTCRKPMGYAGGTTKICACSAIMHGGTCWKHHRTACEDARQEA